MNSRATPLKVLTIVGARPQFVKAGMLSRAFARAAAGLHGLPIMEEIIHTGQHYDAGMSEIFFQELEIPEPVANLGVGSGSHGDTTGRMLAGIEHEIMARRPDWLLVYGDTNSTLAGALAAGKLHIPIAHVEAGLRSFNRRMPEELNRVLTDHASELLFCPTHRAVQNLAREGIREGVQQVGDVMYDAALHYGRRAQEQSTILNRIGVDPGNYYLATVHRSENTDCPQRFEAIFRALERLSLDQPVVFPVHPRTKALVSARPSRRGRGILAIEPVPFLDMIRLEQAASVVLTDSGGVQKEAYFHGVPCVTLRDETEWVETVEAGWNQLAGARTERILAAVKGARNGSPIDEYGNGTAAESIVAAIYQRATATASHRRAA